jgi:thioesterase domain-containing protein/tetratricopeptide (TPR) repeat protein
MVPSAFSWITSNALPLNSSGKVDRKALRITAEKSIPFIHAPTSGSPKTKTEQQLAKLWMRCLDIKLEDIYREDDFFCLGGSSINTTNLLEMISHKFIRGEKLRSDHIYTFSSLREMSACLDGPLFRTLSGKPNQQPLYLIHSITGIHGWSEYDSIAKYLADSCNVMGCQVPSANDFVEYLVENQGLIGLAKYYVNCLMLDEQVSKSNKIILSGWSSGGLIAFLVASELKKLGYDNVEVILIDTTAPNQLSVEYKNDVVKNLITMNRNSRLTEALLNAELDFAKTELQLDSIPHELRLISASSTIKRIGNNDLGWNSFIKKDLPVTVIPDATHFSIKDDATFLRKFNKYVSSKFGDPNPKTINPSNFFRRPISELDLLKAWNLPLPNPNFILRKELHDQIDLALLHSTQPVALVAISGLGGIGKSEIARNYINSNTTYQYKIWFNAENLFQLQQEYIKLGRLLHIINECDLDDIVVSKVKHFLESKVNYLIIYDNADSYQTLERFIPAKGGRILITSRNRSWDETILVNLPTYDEAVAIVKKITKSDSQDINNLVDEMGRLPLALAQASAYIVAKKKSITQYLSVFKELRFKLLADKTMPPGDHHLPVSVTWNLNIKAIQEESIDSFNLLNCLTYLYPVNIPRNYVVHLLANLSRSSNENQFRLDNAIGILLNYSMIDADPDKVSLHRLVQLVMWENHSSASVQQKWISTVLNAIFSLPDSANNPLILGGAAIYPEAMRNIIEYYKTRTNEQPNEGDLFHSLGCCYLVTNEYENAEKSFQQAIILDDNPDIHCEYGQMLYLRNRFEEAIDQFNLSLNLTEDEDDLYFSELEKNTVEEQLKAEIDTRGIVHIRSKFLSEYLLVKCYLKLRHDDQMLLRCYQSFCDSVSELSNDFLIRLRQHLENDINHCDFSTQNGNSIKL